MICKKIRRIRYYFRHETQSKPCEIHVFKVRIIQKQSTKVFMPLIHSLCPQSISIKYGPIMRICKKIEKLLEFTFTICVKSLYFTQCVKSTESLLFPSLIFRPYSSEILFPSLNFERKFLNFFLQSSFHY